MLEKWDEAPEINAITLLTFVSKKTGHVTILITHGSRDSLICKFRGQAHKWNWGIH